MRQPFRVDFGGPSSADLPGECRIFHTRVATMLAPARDTARNEARRNQATAGAARPTSSHTNPRIVHALRATLAPTNGVSGTPEPPRA